MRKLALSLGSFVLLGLLLSCDGCFGRCGIDESPAARGVAQSATLEFRVREEAGAGGLANGGREYEFRGERVLLGAPRRFHLQTVSLGTDGQGLGAVSFELAEPDASEFERWTASILGRQLAIVVDDRVQVLAAVRSELPGRGCITLARGQDDDPERCLREAERLVERLSGG
jgi:preprotein translocase subunit SecD